MKSNDYFEILTIQEKRLMSSIVSHGLIYHNEKEYPSFKSWIRDLDSLNYNIDIFTLKFRIDLVLKYGYIGDLTPRRTSIKHDFK